MNTCSDRAQARVLLPSLHRCIVASLHRCIVGHGSPRYARPNCVFYLIVLVLSCPVAHLDARRLARLAHLLVAGVHVLDTKIPGRGTASVLLEKNPCHLHSRDMTVEPSRAGGFPQMPVIARTSGGVPARGSRWRLRAVRHLVALALKPFGQLGNHRASPRPRGLRNEPGGTIARQPHGSPWNASDRAAPRVSRLRLAPSSHGSSTPAPSMDMPRQCVLDLNLDLHFIRRSAPAGVPDRDHVCCGAVLTLHLITGRSPPRRGGHGRAFTSPGRDAAGTSSRRPGP